MSLKSKVAAISLAALLCLTPGLSQAQINAKDVRKQLTKPKCLTLEEGTEMLTIYADKGVYERVLRDARATGSQSCAKALKEAGDVLVDLLIGVMSRNEDAVCEATTSNRQKELVFNLYRVSTSSTGRSACKTLTR